MKKIIPIVALLLACPATETVEAPDEKKVETVEDAEKKAEEKAAETKKDEKKADG